MLKTKKQLQAQQTPIEKKRVRQEQNFRVKIFTEYQMRIKHRSMQALKKRMLIKLVIETNRTFEYDII